MHVRMRECSHVCMLVRKLHPICQRDKYVQSTASLTPYALNSIPDTLHIPPTPESVWDKCKLACFDFCGLTKVRWHSDENSADIADAEL
jgi:hypothetical protein